ncbi:DegV family protein [Ammoniphilus resinae]|uniref:DegV family protein with EDD domain n=1 Tax=Ammoniphilus resinae TaxID=861532 RepID=A0ABS4GKF0_9BACL|nr:DegV family protein [Ammoniphilus resinae]MBP1930733.1 DegV family protein with EDD domain [Ammoniphilus resinae]
MVPRICVVTDSTADIPKEVAEQWDIHVVPLHVHIDHETFLDGVTITPLEFFEKLVKANNFPTTSQPSPTHFEKKYRELAGVYGEDVQILSIHLSSALSGTYQSANLARSFLDGKIDVSVIDSKKAAFFLGQIVVEAAKAAKSGKSKEDCLALIKRMIDGQRDLFMIDDLTYLQKGGRIGKAQALLGNLLSVKPILSLNEEGEVYPLDKVRGKKKAISKMLEYFHEYAGDEEVLCSVLYGKNHDEAKELAEKISGQFNVNEIHLVVLGPVIGAHAGPQAIAVSMMKK